MDSIARNRLSPPHRDELEASAISQEQIDTRGYATITNPNLLPTAFKGKMRVPGLLIPIRNTQGEIVAWQLKPDAPWRSKEGKLAKYLSAGRIVLDVPDAARPYLRATGEPLFVTEGSKKVDSAVCHGIPSIVGVLGVWMYRSDRMALPDWDDIALNGRTVILAYGSDVMRKAGPRGALEALAQYLEHRGARVRFCLMPDLPDGSKCGLDDAFAAGLTRADLEAMIVDVLPDAEPEWDEPIPLDDPAGPPLPVDALPPVMRDIVEGVAKQVQAPVDLACIAALGTVSAAAGGMFAVSPDGEWHEPAHVMAIGIAPPSTGKSPIFAAITKPLADWQAAQAELVAPLVASWESEQRILEGQLKAAEKERGKASPDGRVTDGVAVWQAAVAELEAHVQRKPIVPRAFVGDVTPEQAARLLHEQGGALAVLSPESPFLSNTIGGRYSDSPNVDLILNGYSGERLDRHRVGGDGFTVERACLTLAVMVQPAVIAMLGRVPETTGRGVSSRLLPVVPVSTVGKRTYGSRAPIPSAACAAWEETILRLLALHNEGEPLVLRLSPDAEQLFARFWDDVERRIEVDGPEMAEWRGKLRGQVLRIAGLLHLMECDHPEAMRVSADTTERAIRLGEYFEAHARVMFSMMLGKRSANLKARQVLEAIQALASEGEPLTKRKVHRKLHGRMGFERANDLDAPLSTLESYGLIQRRQLKTGGRPSEVICLNPMAGSVNSANSPADSEADELSTLLAPVLDAPENVAPETCLDDYRSEQPSQYGGEWSMEI